MSTQPSLGRSEQVFPKEGTPMLILMAKQRPPRKSEGGLGKSFLGRGNSGCKGLEVTGSREWLTHCSIQTAQSMTGVLYEGQSRRRVKHGPDYRIFLAHLVLISSISMWMNFLAEFLLVWGEQVEAKDQIGEQAKGWQTLEARDRRRWKLQEGLLGGSFDTHTCLHKAGPRLWGEDVGSRICVHFKRSQNYPHGFWDLLCDAALGEWGTQ